MNVSMTCKETICWMDCRHLLLLPLLSLLVWMVGVMVGFLGWYPLISAT